MLVAFAGLPWLEGGVVGRVDDELALVRLSYVAAGVQQVVVGIEDLEVLGEQAHRHGTAG